MGPRAPALAALAATLLLARPAFPQPDDLPEARQLDNLTRGFRFEPPLLAIAIAPSDPRVIYVSTAKGWVYVTRDGGISWDGRQVHVYKRLFQGAILGPIRNAGRFHHGRRFRFSTPTLTLRLF